MEIENHLANTTVIIVSGKNKSIVAKINAEKVCKETLFI